MPGNFIPRSKADAIKRALGKVVLEQIRRALEQPEWAEELSAAAQTGDVAAVRAVLEAKVAELDKAVDGLVAAAIAEIDADED